MKHIKVSQAQTANAIKVEDLRTRNAPKTYGREDLYVTISILTREQYLEHRAEWKAAMASLVQEKHELRADKNAQKGPGTRNDWYSGASQELKARARRLLQIRQAVKEWNQARQAEQTPVAA